MVVVECVVTSVLTVHRYFSYGSYLDPVIELNWGLLICSFCWISINAFLMMCMDIYGHVVIVCLGFPALAGAVYNLRKIRRSHLALQRTEKVKDEYGALMQIITIRQAAETSLADKVKNAMLVGVVSIHVVECQSPNCMCKNETGFFDPGAGSFVGKASNYYDDPVFLKYFIKQIYEDALGKFIKSPLLHVSFAGYLFQVMKNNHAAAIELNTAMKKKPSLRQEFAIFKLRFEIERQIRLEAKENYSQLTNVVKFEELLKDCHMTIERVANTQIEFWAQVCNQRPDFDVLDNFANRIYNDSVVADKLWRQLLKINPSYPEALNLYGNYLIEVKNHSQAGLELLERGKKNTHKESLEEAASSTDMLFMNNIAVVHISGNGENLGKIVNVNQALTRVFGYTKTELINHSVNVLMPVMFAKEHDSFLERFFKTGRQTLLTAEKTLYALNREGFCFGIRLFVRQVPDLREGIQYVGMMRQIQDNFDYVLTDQRGVIDSFSWRVSSLFAFPPSFTKENCINIQILAPKLIKVFSNSGKKSLLSRFQEAGGQKLLFTIPKGLSGQAQSRALGRKPTTTSQRDKAPFYMLVNKTLNVGSKLDVKPFTPDELLQSFEYRDLEVRKAVTCEIMDGVYEKEQGALKVRVFKISGLSKKQNESDYNMSSREYGLSNEILMGSSFDYREEPMEESKGTPKEKHFNAEAVPFPPVTEIKEELTTEKLFTNIMTTEERVETGKMSPVRKSRLKKGFESGELSFGKNERTAKFFETLRKSSQSHMELPPVPLKYDTQVVSNFDQLQEVSVQKDLSDSEEPTPKANIGSLKGPSFAAQMDSSDKYHLSTPIHDSGRGGSVQNRRPKAGTLICESKDSISDPPHYAESEANDLRVVKRVKHPAKHVASSFVTDARPPEERKVHPLVNLGSEKYKERSKFDDSSNAKAQLEIESPMMRSKPAIEAQAKGKSGNKENAKNAALAILQQRRLNHLRIMRDPSEFELANYKQTEDEVKLRKSLLAFYTKMNKNKKEEKVEQERNEEDSDESEDEKPPEKSPKPNTVSTFTSESAAAATRSLYSLRAAVDEKFTPPFVAKLWWAASIFFLVILALTVVYFALQFALYEQIQDNIKNIELSEMRLLNLLELNYNVIDMIIISADNNRNATTANLFGEEGFFIGDPEERTQLFEEAIVSLKAAAKVLKETQLSLSQSVKQFSSSAMRSINPTNMPLLCMGDPGVFTAIPYTMWEAIMEIVVSAYRISGMSIGEVDDTVEPSVTFVTENSVNNILAELNTSTEAIMDEIKKSIKGKKKVFIAFLCVASAAVALAVLIILPIVREGKRNKEEVYKLFMLIRKHTAHEQTNKCKKFLTTFQTNQETEYLGDDGTYEEGDADVTANSLHHKKRYVTSRKKFKSLTLNFGFTIIKILFPAMIIEGYFILDYFLSHTFLKEVSSLAEELNALYSRMPANVLLLVAQRYFQHYARTALYKNYTTTVNNENITEFLEQYYDTLYQDEERLLEVS